VTQISVDAHPSPGPAEPGDLQLSPPETNIKSAHVWLMAFCVGAVVANIYYIQPLLSTIAATFRISVPQVGSVAMLTQFGGALGMLIFVPLGDTKERRRLIVSLLLAECVCLALMATAQNFVWLALAAFGIGVTTATVHVVVPFAAQTGFVGAAWSYGRRGLVRLVVWDFAGTDFQRFDGRVAGMAVHLLGGLGIDVVAGGVDSIRAAGEPPGVATFVVEFDSLDIWIDSQPAGAAGVGRIGRDIVLLVQCILDDPRFLFADSALSLWQRRGWAVWSGWRGGRILRAVCWTHGRPAWSAAECFGFSAGRAALVCCVVLFWPAHRWIDCGSNFARHRRTVGPCVEPDANLWVDAGGA
jgi:MFS family permease